MFDLYTHPNQFPLNVLAFNLEYEHQKNTCMGITNSYRKVSSGNLLRLSEEIAVV